MKAKFLTILIILTNVLTFGQTENIFSVDYNSQYEGGGQAFRDLINKNIKYPVDAKESGRQGLVVVGFTLTKDAKIINAKIKNSVGMGCDEETIRLLKLIEGKLTPKSDSDQYFEFTMRFQLMDTKDVQKLIEKADKLYSKEKYHDALNILDEIIRQSPYNIDMLLKRGVARQKNGDNSNACADWLRIRELRSNLADSFINENCK